MRRGSGKLFDDGDDDDGGDGGRELYDVRPYK